MAREQTNGGPRDGRQAAEQFADAVRDEAVRFFNAVLEEARRNPEAFRPVPEPLPEEEAARVAGEAVHEVRRTAAGAGGFDREAITPEEAREWVRRREDRRRREGYRPV